MGRYDMLRKRKMPIGRLGDIYSPTATSESPSMYIKKGIYDYERASSCPLGKRLGSFLYAMI